MNFSETITAVTGGVITAIVIIALILKGAFWAQDHWKVFIENVKGITLVVISLAAFGVGGYTSFFFLSITCRIVYVLSVFLAIGIGFISAWLFSMLLAKLLNFEDEWRGRK